MKKILVLVILPLIYCLNVSAAEKNIDILEKEFIDCADSWEKHEQKCPESWSMKCYNHLMTAHKNTQQCFQKVAVKLFTNFYELSEKEANKKIDDFLKFTYDQYFFIFAETDFCKKNNCGLSIYLYSEYVTTDQLRYYVNKIIRSISARN